jgi:hypothetical protein
VLFGLRAKPQLIDVVDDLAQVIAALNLVLEFDKDLADLVFDGVGPGGPLREALQVGEQLLVDEIPEIIAGQGACCGRASRPFAFGRRPVLPAIGLVEDVGVFLAVNLGFRDFVLLEPIEVF